MFIGCVGGFGVTGGVHRLWTHRSYKAKWPLRVILAVCYSVSGQVRDISCLNFLFALERPTIGILTFSFSPFQENAGNNRRGGKCCELNTGQLERRIRIFSQLTPALIHGMWQNTCTTR